MAALSKLSWQTTFAWTLGKLVCRCNHQDRCSKSADHHFPAAIENICRLLDYNTNGSHFKMALAQYKAQDSSDMIVTLAITDLCARVAPLQRRQASFRPFQSPSLCGTPAKRAIQVLAAASAKELAAKFGRL